MNEAFVHYYWRPYRDFASKINNGLCAFERCESSLIAGKGLCRGEIKFLQFIRFRIGLFPPKLSELQQSLLESNTPLLRESTEEEDIFWRDFFSDLRKNKRNIK